MIRIKRILTRIISRLKKWYRARREHRITLEGIIFIFITFFIGFAAINTSTNLLYLIMSMMLSFLIISGYLSTNNLKKLDIKRLAVRHISAREEAFIQIEVKNNKKRLSTYSLRIMDYLKCGDLVGINYLFHTGPRSRQTISYKVKFPRRGLYKLSDIRIVTRFPFGFFERSFTVQQNQEILVYPRIVDVRPILKGSEVDFGEYDAGKKGHGHSLYGLREYSPADSARFIHWKVSARSSKIMIREFEKEEKKKVTILLNNFIPGPLSTDTQNTFEKAVIYTASITKYLIDRNFQVQLVTGSGHITFGTGISHIYRILRALALIQLEEKNEPCPILPAVDADSTNVNIHFDYRHSPVKQADFAQIIDITKINFTLENLELL
jgi:uncharacterized protein (DUF58 family)